MVKRAFAVVALFIASAFGEPGPLHDQIEAIRTKANIPAISVIASDAGHVLVRDCWGTIASDSKEPVTLDDQWHLGSDTKAMTSTLAAKLVEQGKLKWTTTLIEACPTLKGKINAGWENITLEQFCTQVSGIGHSIETPAFFLTMRGLDTNPNLTPRERRERAIATILKTPPTGKPGVKFEYANLNFIIAGHMLESVTNRNWEDLIVAELFKPLGITTAGFGPPPRVKGHEKGKPVVADNPPVLGPAGTLYLSLDDWLKFCELHAGKGPADFLTKKTLTTLHTPVLDNYAMGWIVLKGGDGTPVLTHDGSNSMWYARAIVRPSDDRIILIAMNVADQKACDQITATVTTALFSPGAKK